MLNMKPSNGYSSNPDGTATSIQTAQECGPPCDIFSLLSLSFLQVSSLLSYILSNYHYLLQKISPQLYRQKHFQNLLLLQLLFRLLSCSLSSSISSFATLTCVSPRPTSEIPLFFDVLETGACSFYRINLSSLSCST